MSDPFAARLAELAPAVDLHASRELFESLRSEDGSGDQQHSNRRWLLAAACVLLLVAGAVGVWAVAGRDGDRAPATPPTDSTPSRGDGTEFRLIAMEPVGDGLDGRGIHVADAREELGELLAGYQDSFDRHAAEVEFEQSAEIAVVIERFDNACPLEIERFTPIESTWRVEWADKSAEPCEDIGLGWVYLVAIPRNALTGIDTIVLPAEQLGSTELPELTASINDPAVNEMTTHFATGGIDGRVPAHDIAVFVDQADWDAYVATELAGDEQALIDLDQFIVVVVRRADADEGCPDSFDRFGIDGDVWTPVFVPVTAECDDGPITTTYVVGVARTALPGRVTFSLPAIADHGLDEVSVTVDIGPNDGPAKSVPPTASSPTSVAATTPAEAEEAALDAATTLVLDVNSGTDGGIVVGASNQAEFDVAMMRFPDVAAPPEIDFDTHIAIVFTTMDDGCRAELRGLDIVRMDGGPLRLMPQLVEPVPPDLVCTAVGIPRLFVVTVERGVLPDVFEIFIPPNAAPNEAGVLSAIDLTYDEPRVVLVAESPADPGSVFAATSPVSYDAVWRALDTDVQQPTIDFGRELAVAFVVPDDACPPTFDGFDITNDAARPVLTPRLVETSTTCRLPLVSRLFVVAVDRASVDGGAVLRLPADDAAGIPEALVEVDPAFAIDGVDWACGATDAVVVNVTTWLPESSDVTVDLVDGGRSVAQATTRSEGGPTTLTLQPVYTGTPSSNGEIVVTNNSTGHVVLRQPFDHTNTPDGFGCG